MNKKYRISEIQDFIIEILEGNVLETFATKHVFLPIFKTTRSLQNPEIVAVATIYIANYLLFILRGGRWKYVTKIREIYLTMVSVWPFHWKQGGSFCFTPHTTISVNVHHIFVKYIKCVCLEIIVTIVIVLNYFDGCRCIKLYT